MLKDKENVGIFSHLLSTICKNLGTLYRVKTIQNNSPRTVWIHELLKYCRVHLASLFVRLYICLFVYLLRFVYVGLSISRFRRQMS